MTTIQQQMMAAESDREQEAAGDSDRFSSNYMATLFPDVVDWIRVHDLDMIKKLSKCEASNIGKPRYQQKELGDLLGMGIFTSNGDLWKHERDKVIAPKFHAPMVKGMVGLMEVSAKDMLDSWENIIDSEGGRSAEVVVDESLRSFAADVIARACFGSSYSESKEIFTKIRQLQMALAEQTTLFGAPGGSRCTPPTKNSTDENEIRDLKARIRSLILDMANKRPKHSNAATPAAATDEKKADKYKGLILVDSIVEGAKQAGSLSMAEEDFIVDNCKTIFFAGHETTAATAAWCLMLLASHPEWQTKARDEVLHKVCDCEEGKVKALDMKTLGEVKTVTAVIQETLRLYPPMPFVTREALTGLKLDDGRDIKKGTNIWVPIALVHRAAAADGGFDPGRFADGSARACPPPHKYMPFGMAPRACVGEILAMAELKVLLAHLLSRFELKLSPRYVHEPAFRLSVEPGEGVPLILKKLDR